MLKSGINSDTRSIPAGAPITGKASRTQLDRVVLAGPGLLAAGVAKSGAVTGGVIPFYTTGVVDVDDWTLVAGTKRLITGSLYRLAATVGKLSPTGTGQIIGLAVSATQLSIQIGQSDTSETTARTASESSLQSQIDALVAKDVETDNDIIDLQTADTALQAQITVLQAPTYANNLLLGGM